MSSFEERFSNLFQRGSARAQEAVAAAQGKMMPPMGGNRIANFIAAPPGTDPSVNYTDRVLRGVYRVPQTVRSVFDNNSPIPIVSAKPQRIEPATIPVNSRGGRGSTGPGVRSSELPIGTQPLARGATSPSWRERVTGAVSPRVEAARSRIRRTLGA